MYIKKYIFKENILLIYIKEILLIFLKYLKIIIIMYYITRPPQNWIFLLEWVKDDRELVKYTKNNF